MLKSDDNPQIVSNPKDPWDWYIYLHLVDFYGFHVGKYTIHVLWIRHGKFKVCTLKIPSALTAHEEDKRSCYSFFE